MGMTASVFGGGKAAKKVGESLVPGLPALPGPAETTPVLMPDPLEQNKARERSLIEQLSRSGRKSTMLTQQSGGGQKLGS